MHEHAFQRHGVLVVRSTVLVAQAIDLAVRARDLHGLGIGVHGHVGQTVQLLHQHRVCLQFRHELDHCHLTHHAGQVNRRFHAGVAATNHRHVLALEQRAIAMRAIRDALVFVLGLARHIHVAPACAGRQDDGFALERAAIGQLHLDQATRLCCRHDGVGTLQVHDVDVIRTGVRFQCGGEFRPVGLQHRNVVLDGHGVVGLAAKAFGHDAGTNAFAGGVHARRSARRPTAHDQHVKRFFLGQPGGILGSGTGVDLGQNFFDQHTTRTKHGAVQKDHGHGHDLALGHFFLEGTAFNDRGLDLGVENSHQAQGLHNVRAVVAGQAHVDLKIEVAPVSGAQALDLLDDVRLDLGRVAAAPQQGQHQRGKFMAQRQPGKAQAGVSASTLQGERRLAGVSAIGAQCDLVAAQALNGLQQVQHFAAGLTVVQRGHHIDRQRHAFQVGCKLCFECFVEHGGFLFATI